MVWRRIKAYFAEPAFIFGWVWLNLWWISADRLLRDGDEEGHVGAMELFKDIWIEQGILSWLWETWQGNYGEYPPLFAGIMGAWWGIITQLLGTTPPSDITVRGSLLIWPLITACGVARIAFRMKWDWKFAGMTTLLTPLLVGVGRHFMLEPMMTALSTLSIATAVEWKYNPTVAKASATGLLLGLGALTKQTMIVVAPWVILTIFGAENKRWHILFTLLCCAIVVGPWFLGSLSVQEQYLTASVAGKTETISMQLIFYPLTLFYSVGLLSIFLPLLKLANVKAIPTLIWVWIGTLFLLMLIPKQYPRLMLAWLPVVSLLLSCGMANMTHKRYQQLILIGVILIGVLGLQPTFGFQKNLENHYKESIFSRTDDGCPQIWIRPPSRIDGGLYELTQSLQDHPTRNRITIFGNPKVPCHIQTTHAWRNHLEPYLRRRDIEATVTDVSDLGDPMWQDANIQIIWKGDTIETPMEMIVQP